MKPCRQPVDEWEPYEAFRRRIRSMTREDWLKSIDELSRAPEGVEDPWPPYTSDFANGSVPPSAIDEPATVREHHAVPGEGRAAHHT